MTKRKPIYYFVPRQIKEDDTIELFWRNQDNTVSCYTSQGEHSTATLQYYREKTRAINEETESTAQHMIDSYKHYYTDENYIVKRSATLIKPKF